MTDAAWSVVGLLAGLIAGSFVATVAIRWPEGRSAMRGRSTCDRCGKVLGSAELVPVLSYLWQRGRCRRCGEAIDARHPAVEAAAGLVGLTAMVAAPGVTGAAGALFGWLLLLLAVLDVTHHWLPDRLTWPTLALGLAAGAAGVMPDLLTRAVGAAAGFGALLAIAVGYRALRGREGMGGGDPKLMGAIGAWLGWAPLPFVLLLASLVGLMAALAARLRGERVDATMRLPLGALLAVAAYPAWLVVIGQAT